MAARSVSRLQAVPEHAKAWTPNRGRHKASTLQRSDYRHGKALARPAQLTYANGSVTEQNKFAAIAKGRCAGAEVCPLSRVPVGTTVCIKALAASPEIRERLRALGLSEKQELKLLSREANFVCQVCNATLDLNAELAEAILVEIPLPVRQLQSLVADVSQPKTRPLRAAMLILISAAALLIVGVFVWQGLTAHGNPNPATPNVSPSAATLDIGVLVFREGLETILVLAAIVASMTGARAAAAQARNRRRGRRLWRHVGDLVCRHGNHQQSPAKRLRAQFAGGHRAARGRGAASGDELVFSQNLLGRLDCHAQPQQKEVIEQCECGGNFAPTAHLGTGPARFRLALPRRF